MEPRKVPQDLYMDMDDMRTMKHDDLEAAMLKVCKKFEKRGEGVRCS